MIFTRNNLKCLIVEGNIGAGKSTFLKLVKDRLPVQIVYEPIERWQNVGENENLLDKFYHDTPRWAYTFQSFAFITRVLEAESFAQKSKFPTQLLERSVYSDRYCFAKNLYQMGKMTALEWKLYQEWFAWLVDTYTQKPDGFIYLKTDPKVCYSRLKKRNRSEEDVVTLDYLKMVHQRHEEWLVERKDIADYLKDIPVLTLECNECFETNKEQQDAHIEAIAQFFNIDPVSALQQSHITERSL